MSDDFNTKFQSSFSKLKLHNSDEIYNFVAQNKILLDNYNDIIKLIGKYFPNSSYSLEFDPDSEFDDLDQLIVYVHVDEEDFENEWEKLKELNEEIREVFGKRIKELISVDLW